MATTHKATTYLIVTAAAERTRDDATMNYKNGDQITVYMGRNGDPRGYSDMPAWNDIGGDHFFIDENATTETAVARLRERAERLPKEMWGFKLIPDTIEVRQIHEFTMTIRDKTVVG